jgi:transcriptional regulator with XRE-family HTH domain
MSSHLSSAARFSLALRGLRWGPRELAEMLAINERTIRRWLSGQNDPPPALLEWLELLAAFVNANPPPPGPAA